MDPKRITVDMLHAEVARFPTEMRDNPAGRVFGVAITVIEHFFGSDWVAAHIRPDVRRRGYLNLDHSSDPRRKASTFRAIEFAENLLNLQHIDGFGACMTQMRGGGNKIESTCAELDFGRFLYIHDVEFRFIEPQMTKGADYDFDIIYPDGLTVAADAKCKFESASIKLAGVQRSLRRARGQLPKDRPGIVFVKIPQLWIGDPETARELVNVARTFMATTSRVVSVKFYVSQLTIGNGDLLHRHAIRELTNDACRFHAGRD